MLASYIFKPFNKKTEKSFKSTVMANATPKSLGGKSSRLEQSAARNAPSEIARTYMLAF